MKRVFVPTESGSDWKRLLAQPDLHWKPGRSAMSAAAAWEGAGDCLPRELSAALTASQDPDLLGLDLLLAVPEWETPLPGGVTTSHTDILALLRNDRGLVVLAVEAKVDEEFGPTIGQKRAAASDGKTERLNFLHRQLQLDAPLPDSVRYQLLHRAASAILTARMFQAHAAVMLVQSFGAAGRWREDFEAFCLALGVSQVSNGVSVVPGHKTPRFFMGWCVGDRRFCDVDLRVAR